MSYALGLDLGTTYTAAAVWRAGTVEMVGLGTHGHVIASVVHLREDRQLITGEAAVRRSLTDPGRTAREFKRRLGDPTPILLGTSPFAAVDLMTALLRDVLASVGEREGGPPLTVALTHPANWGEFKVDLLRQAADACGLRDVTLVTEPVAAAVHYAAGANVQPGQIVAVYDLGGGTFDVAVLRRTEDGFETLGEPAGLERLGGVDFDHAVMAHVERALAEPLASMDREDPEVATALARLRQECVAAKEGLSEDSEVAIPVALPGLWTEVRLTRREFETMIAPALIEPMRAFNRALASAGVTGADIHTVLLVGGSSRVPLVAETVAGALGRPVAVDTHPKYAVALGAARIVGTALTRRDEPARRSAAPTAAMPPVVEATDPPAPSEAPVPAPTRATRPRRKRRSMVYAGIAAAGLAVGLGSVFAFGALGQSSSPPPDTSGDVASSTTTPVTTPATAPVVADEESEPTPTTQPAPPAVTCGSSSGLCAFITDISLDGDRYIADYATLGFEPLIPGEDAGATDDDHHVHFFFDTTAAGNAGENGNPPGSWELWGLQRGGGRKVFDAFTVADADAAGASQLCVAVATHHHEVLSDADRTGNCVELPA